MNISSLFLALKAGKTAISPLFPFPVTLHLVFVFIGTAFFVWQFTVKKRPQHLLLAVGFVLSLGLWMFEQRTVYYLIGILEVLLLAAALVCSIIWNRKEKSAEVSRSQDSEKSEPEEQV